jgi:hypothetical protein
MEYKLGRITKGRMFIEPIVPQNLSTIINNKIMLLEYIFQDISKQMLETTYTPKLGQLLKITPDLKKYMWQNLKPKKPNIATTMILEPNVAIVIKTHSEVHIITREVDN